MAGFPSKSNLLGAILILLTTLLLVPRSKAALSAQYYVQTCPQVEKIIFQTVHDASIYDSKVPARLLRMFFHDCFIRVFIIFTIILIFFYPVDKNGRRRQVYRMHAWYVHDVCCGKLLVGMWRFSVARLDRRESSRERWASQPLTRIVPCHWRSQSEVRRRLSSYCFVRWYTRHCRKRCSYHGAYM